MTGRDQMESEVRTVLGQVLGVDPSGIGPGFDDHTCGDWTSLNHLMLISQLESRFGVVFANSEIAKLTSFDAIVGALEQRRRASA